MMNYAKNASITLPVRTKFREPSWRQPHFFRPFCGYDDCNGSSNDLYGGDGVIIVIVMV